MNNNDRIEERCKRIAEYVIKEKATVRQVAKKMGIAKSTVHNDLVNRLPEIDGELAKEAREVLDHNKAERHIRGGVATQNKFKIMSSKK